MSMRFAFQTGVLVMLCVCMVAADEVRMRNGDRYAGKVKSVDADAVTLQSDLLGTVKLPRNKIASIEMGTAGSIASQTNAGPAKATTNALPRLPDLSQLGTNDASAQASTELIKDMTPEARERFTQMLRGLVTGQLTVQDLRKEAKATADQVRALRAELGPEGGPALDGYLEVLDRFLEQSAEKQPRAEPARRPAKTNTAPARVK